ncbi:MAG: class I SAM-dependent methyltransferase [Desulfobulbaceae bacterium]|jgi:2-polyprenyl-3-methyl-5-hydroxy-6-metoxy-1,4-benzoquinol methylase
MSDSQTDQDWEHFAREDPYWAVVTNESFRKENFDEGAKAFFFKTGEEYIGHIFQVIHSCISQNFHPESALDFGSGVGRLAVPLAKRCGRVIGVDVSESMLKESRRVVQEKGLNNIDFVKGDDFLSAVSGNFDLINSYIVLQHIPTARGIRIVQRLVDLLREGGVGVLHVTYGRYATAPKAGGKDGLLSSHLKQMVPAGARKGWRRVLNALRNSGCDADASRKKSSKELNSPSMQMNHYDLNQVFRIVQSAGGKTAHLEFTNHSGTLGVIIFFQKAAGVAPAENY